MQKLILSLFLGIICGFTSTFGAWGPGAYQPYGPPQYSPYQGFGHGGQRISSFQGPFLGNTLTSSCSTFACGSLRGFRGCLASPQSIYRFYAYHRHHAQSAKARDARMRFIYAFPDCFKSFCRNVCIQPQTEKAKTSSKQGTGTSASKSGSDYNDLSDEDTLLSEEESLSGSDESDDDSLSDSDEDSDITGGSSVSETKPKRKSRTSGFFKRFRSGKAWVRDQYKSFQKSRSKTKLARLKRATTLCRERSAEGYELRAFCTECIAYIASNQELNPACRLTSKETADLDREARRTAQTTPRTPSQRYMRPSGRYPTARSGRRPYDPYDDVSRSYGERSGYNIPYAARGRSELGQSLRRRTNQGRLYEGRSLGYEEASLNYYPSGRQSPSRADRQFDSMPTDTYLDGLSGSSGRSGSATTEGSRSPSGASRKGSKSSGSGTTQSDSSGRTSGTNSASTDESANAESFWSQSDVSR